MLSDRELQARHYWRMMQSGMAELTVTEFKDEMATLGRRTESPVLRELCARNETRYDRSFTVVRAAVR
jgi:hypothetical protein